MQLRTVGILLAVLFCVSPALADETYTPTTLTADQVLAHARKARGVWRAGSYHETSRTTGNGTTSQSETYESGDDYKTIVHDGDYTTAYGYRDGASWWQDANGAVTIKSGFHVTENPFANALHDVNATSSTVKVLGVTTSAPACIVLEVAPKNGLLQRRYYDASSFLLRRVQTTSYDGQTEVYAYSNFRTAFGETFPQEVTYSDGHPENAETTDILSYETTAVAPANLALPASRPLFDLQGRPSLKIPADFTDGDGVVVRVTIAGRGLDFLLDSGSSSLVIDESVARELGLPLYELRKGSLGGDFNRSLTRVSDLALGDLHAQNVAMEAIPYSTMVGDRKVVGLIGGDFFASGRVTIDFQHQTLSLEASADTPAAPWVALPIEVDDLVPRVHVKFNGVDGRFMIDTGAFETTMFEHYFSQFHPNRIGDEVGQVIGIAQKATGYQEYVFSRFDFGDLAFADARTIVIPNKKWEEFSYDGLIGRSILSNFNLMFDYPNHKLYIESLLPQ